jgi:putative transposase
MARLGRTFLPDQPLHVIARGNNRGAVFFGEDDYAQYGGWLAEAADGYGCRIHADVFMTNHVHLLATPECEDSLPRTMQSLGRLCAHHQHGVSPNRNAPGGAHPGRADRH